jgi:predicted membrane-bound dolichyl-phosphate-mannose-protein mannosyltransferase
VTSRANWRLGEKAHEFHQLNWFIFAVPFGTRITGSLYTTFEPCMMCAATIAFYRVPKVHFAAADPFFDGPPRLDG